jgi:hypothetical protein
MTANMAGAPFERLTALRKIEGVARPTKLCVLCFFAVSSALDNDDKWQ